MKFEMNLNFMVHSCEAASPLGIAYLNP
jgi:hypothetical protein